MQKVLIIMMFDLLFFSCAEAPKMKEVITPEAPEAPIIPSEKPFIPFNEQELGYMVSISLIDNDNNNYTYDYTGLGINDNYLAELTANYFLDNLTQTIETKTSIILKARTAFWFIGGNNCGIVDKDYYKQSFDLPTVNPNITRVSVVIKHISYVNDLLSENSFFYKGLNNGSGDMELVGKMTENKDGVTKEGDTSPLEPYYP